MDLWLHLCCALKSNHVSTDTLHRSMKTFVYQMRNIDRYNLISYMGMTKCSYCIAETSYIIIYTGCQKCVHNVKKGNRLYLKSCYLYVYLYTKLFPKM